MTIFLRFARTTPVGKLTVGARVVVEGRVEADTTVKVPGSDLACVYHDTSIDEFRTGVRQGRPMWIPTTHDEELLTFWVADAEGRVFVRPDPGRVKVRGGRDARGNGKRRATRFVARYITRGDVVRVRGTVMAPLPDKKGRVRPGFDLVGTDADPMIILFRRPGT